MSILRKAAYSCTCCYDAGWLFDPYSSRQGDYFPCPCCTQSVDRWSDLESRFVDRKTERDAITSAWAAEDCCP